MLFYNFLFHLSLEACMILMGLERSYTLLLAIYYSDGFLKKGFTRNNASEM